MSKTRIGTILILSAPITIQVVLWFASAIGLIQMFGFDINPAYNFRSLYFKALYYLPFSVLAAFVWMVLSRCVGTRQAGTTGEPLIKKQTDSFYEEN